MGLIFPRAQAPVLKNRPYVATFHCQTQGADGKLEVGRMFRASNGDTRIDFSLPNGAEMRVLDDTSERVFSFLYMEQKVLQRDRYKSHFDDWVFRGNPTITGDRRTIHGCDCVRLAFQTAALGETGTADAGESWLSRTEGIVMLDRDPSSGWVWELNEIEFHEPPPSTFDLPDDFQVVDGKK